MLFNSYMFIFAFLPTVYVGYRLLEARRRAALGWLAAGSLFFYGWWNPAFLLLLGGSISLNYLLGLTLSRMAVLPVDGDSKAPSRKRARTVLALGVVANLATLAYFKYAEFLVSDVLGVTWDMAVVLPLAISFFTFQQIAFLVDAFQGRVSAYGFVDYCLFVSFFPQLIAGPIVHHGEVMPQFRRGRSATPDEDLAVGSTIFTVGLAKKVLIADTLATYASPVFHHAESGVPDVSSAWAALLAYTFQIYFDFSGYSDMAIGLARIFGIRLPENFNSPYKATTIADFWRRWHMTLSRFLRDYLYIPLGGNRLGPARRYTNLMTTMLLGGLWHGAGWTFVIWGGLHGTFLIVERVWRRLRGDRPGLPAWCGRALTFLAVVFAWLFFKSADFESVGRMLSGLLGHGGSEVLIDIRPDRAFILLAVLAPVVWIAPNTREWVLAGRPDPAVTRAPGIRFGWCPTLPWSLVVVVVFVWSVMRISSYSEFIYFRF